MIQGLRNVEPTLSLIGYFHRAGLGVLDLVFPPRCFLCSQPGTPLCDDCCQAFPRVLPPTCQLCGAPTDAPGSCGQCRRAPLAIDGIRSVLLLEEGARRSIHELKYHNRRSLVVVLARLMADQWRAAPLPADVLVPVPLHPARQRERGYNQAELLARALGDQIGLPVMKAGLRRVRYTRSQTSLSADDRRSNVGEAFAYQPLNAGDEETIMGRRIVVVDDVCTTGSTLEACSLALKAAGAAAVWGFTLARTPHPGRQ